VAAERIERPTADRKDPRSPMYENRALPNGIVARLEALGQQLIALPESIATLRSANSNVASSIWCVRRCPICSGR